MGILVKLFLGAAVVGGATTAVAIAVDNHQQKKAEQKVKEAKNDIERAKAVVARDEREKKSVIQRIKKYVQKKVVKILAVVALHMEQIEALGAIIGLGSAFISIAGAIKDFKNSNDTQEKLDKILDKMKADEEAINNNQLLFGSAADLILAKMDISQDEFDKHFESVKARHA